MRALCAPRCTAEQNMPTRICEASIAYPVGRFHIRRDFAPTEKEVFVTTLFGSDPTPVETPKPIEP